MPWRLDVVLHLDALGYDFGVSVASSMVGLARTKWLCWPLELYSSTGLFFEDVQMEFLKPLGGFPEGIEKYFLKLFDGLLSAPEHASLRIYVGQADLFGISNMRIR